MLNDHIKIIRSIITKAGKKDAWEFSNSILYKLCKKYPENSKGEVVLAKTLIIGRVYSAALERGTSSKKESGTDFYLKQVFPSIDKFFKDKSTILNIKKLNKDKELQPVIELHGGLVTCLKKLRNSRKISFASKYLHFHYKDSFYIYDSRAKWALSLLKKYLTNKNITIGEIEISENVNTIKEYYSFVKQVASVKQAVEGNKKKFTIREFDNIMIQIADAIPKKKSTKKE